MKFLVFIHASFYSTFSSPYQHRVPFSLPSFQGTRSAIIFLYLISHCCSVMEGDSSWQRARLWHSDRAIIHHCTTTTTAAATPSPAQKGLHISHATAFDADAFFDSPFYMPRGKFPVEQHSWARGPIQPPSCRRRRPLANCHHPRSNLRWSRRSGRRWSDFILLARSSEISTCGSFGIFSNGCRSLRSRNGRWIGFGVLIFKSILCNWYVWVRIISNFDRFSLFLITTTVQLYEVSLCFYVVSYSRSNTYTHQAIYFFIFCSPKWYSNRFWIQFVKKGYTIDHYWICYGML